MLERAVQLLIVGSIVTALLAAGSLLDVLDEARKARWLFLLLLAGAAAAYALPRVREVRLGWPYRLAAALTALALLSAAWSSRPGLTFARGVSLGLILGAAAAVAIGATGRLDSMRRVVDAIVAAGAVVAVGGLLVLAFDHDRAVQPASAQEAARFQGLGGGPNVAPMLFAVTLPLAVSIAVEARTPLRRWIAVAVALLLLGSIVASGSRGALFAAAAGLAAFAVLSTSRVRVRALALAAVAVVAAVGAVAMRLPDPDPSAPARAGTSLAPQDTFPPKQGYLDANAVWRLQEDIGRPPWGQVASDTSRSFLGGSGRTQAWAGALRLTAERPVVGYGFGLESDVFVDRYLKHGSNQPENSYVGLSLQLGVVGVAVFLALVGSLLLAAWHASRHARVRLVSAAAAGAFVAGLALALTQSFVYAAGNNATLAVWLAAFLLPAAADG
jgi:O-Antigen ligase